MATLRPASPSPFVLLPPLVETTLVSLFPDAVRRLVFASLMLLTDTTHFGVLHLHGPEDEVVSQVVAW